MTTKDASLRTPLGKGEVICDGKFLYQANPGSGPFGGGNWEKYPPAATALTVAVNVTD